MDKIEIYNKLVSVKPFFELKSKNDIKVTKTRKTVALVQGAGGVWFDASVTGGAKHVIKGPVFLLF